MPARRSAPPLLLSTANSRQETVARCCSIARRAGVHPGMALAEAKASCPGARIAPFDSDKSRQAMELLAKWCLRFSPVVTVDPIPAGHQLDDVPDGLLLDVTGESHLFGGEHLLLTDVATRLNRIGFSSRLAIAPTIGAAWALARFGRHPIAIVEESRIETCLASLPVSALRLPLEIRIALQEVGIEQVRHLLTISRESLVVRFGEDLLLRLDQAFGRSDELLTPLRFSDPLSTRRLFEGATTQIEAIVLTVKELIAELAQQLLAKESGVRGLKLEWLRINASAVSREFTLGRPSRDGKHLWDLVRPKVESMHMGYGVEGVTLTAYWTQSIPHRQAETWGIEQSDDADDAEYQEFLDTLVNRWGKSRILSPHPVASYVPEAAWQFRSAGDEPGTPAKVLCVDRPSLLFERPEPAEGMALEPDHPPAWIRWREKEYLLAAGFGPERIVTEWWSAQHGLRAKSASTRDYFKVKTAGAIWLWVYRELESSRWFVHGMWA
jgi:protein ImuB